MMLKPTSLLLYTDQLELCAGDTATYMLSPYHLRSTMNDYRPGDYDGVLLLF